MTRAWITEVVLLAQFVGDVGHRRIQIAEVAYDLGASAAVVGNFAQRHHVDTIVDADRTPAARWRIAAAGLRHRNATAAAATRERERNRQTRLRLLNGRRRPLECRF